MCPRRVSPDRPRPAYTVFISHSSADTWVAKKIAQEIEDLGAVTFLDEAHVLVGDDFEPRIFDALGAANELVVLLTPWAVERPYVWAELGAARVRNIRMIGVLHGLSVRQFLSRPKTLILITERNLIDLNQIDKYFAELRTRVGKRPARRLRGVK